MPIDPETEKKKKKLPKKIITPNKTWKKPFQKSSLFQETSPTFKGTVNNACFAENVFLR